MSLAELEPEEEVLPGCFVYERKNFQDQRGMFTKLFAVDFKRANEQLGTLKEVNLSTTLEPGTIRGMHYQLAPFQETKLVTCIGGEILDVIIDLRENSDSFLQHRKRILSATNFKSILIPKGFAHGFQALTENVQVLYCVDEKFVPSHQGGINPLDEFFSIDWPLEPINISTQDLNWEKWQGEVTIE